MPRRARIVVPGVPHHVTQRGNHRQPVFLKPGDPAAYLSLLLEYSRKFSVEVVAYSLMRNHVHHVVVPEDLEGLQRLFKAVHGSYAQRVNRMHDQSGHLWQGRYFSSPLDSNYFLTAVRYVELNPVRAGLVGKAEDFEWSSAAVHCGLRRDLVVDPVPRSPVLAGIPCWSRWLAAGVDDQAIETLRRNGSQNLPCGSAEFIEGLERLNGRPLQFSSHGGPRASSQKEAKPGSSRHRASQVPTKVNVPLV